MSLAEAVLNALVGAVLLVAYLLLAGYIEIRRTRGAGDGLTRQPSKLSREGFDSLAPLQSDSPHAPQSEAAPPGVSGGYSSRRQDAPRSC
jgi:hypothetical protein